MVTGAQGSGIVSRFEDLIAWRKARQLTREVYRLSKNQEFQRDFGLRDQIRRASVSVISNIAEGFERGSRPKFDQFLVIAKASCGEVRSQAYVALDAGYLTESEFQQLRSLTDEVSRIIGGLRASVQRQRDNQ